ARDLPRLHHEIDLREGRAVVRHVIGRPGGVPQPLFDRVEELIHDCPADSPDTAAGTADYATGNAAPGAATRAPPRTRPPAPPARDVPTPDLTPSCLGAGGARDAASPSSLAPLRRAPPTM